MSTKCKWNAKQRNAKCDDLRLPKRSNGRRKRAIELEVIPGMVGGETKSFFYTEVDTTHQSSPKVKNCTYVAVQA